MSSGPSHPLDVRFHQGTLQLKRFDRSTIDRLIAESIPILWDDRQRLWVCDAMHASRIRSRLAQWGFVFAEPSLTPRTANAEHGGQPVLWAVNESDQSVSLPPSRLPPLRPDQQNAIDHFIRGGSQGIIVMPTGTGKTVVALSLLARWRCSTLIVVPVRDLMYQWHELLRRNLSVDAGLIGDGVHRVSPISVTTYDSAAIHMPRIGNRFQMVIFDEVHHLAGDWRCDAARMSAASIRLGLTATLPGEPEKIERLIQLLGPVVYQQSIEQASGKTLAPYTVRRIAVPMTEAEDAAYRRYGKTIQEFVRERRGQDPQFQWDHIYSLVADPSLDPAIAAMAAAAMQAFRAKRKIEEQATSKFRVLEDLFRLHAGEPVLVFTGSNVMARQISTRFLIPCLLSHCAKRERQDLLAGFADGRYPVLVANRVLDEGVDLPQVKTAIVLGGLSSTRQATQRLGRVLRKSPSGQAAVLYEIVTDGSNEVQRSRDRRRTAAYQSKRPAAGGEQP